jgi:hypothetical protein
MADPPKWLVQSFVQQLIADEKRGAQHAVGLMGGILDIHNHLDSSLNVAAFGADLSRLGNACGLLKLAMNIRKKSFRDSIGCGSIHVFAPWLDLHPRCRA